MFEHGFGKHIGELFDEYLICFRIVQTKLKRINQIYHFRPLRYPQNHIKIIFLRILTGKPEKARFTNKNPVLDFERMYLQKHRSLQHTPNVWRADLTHVLAIYQELVHTFLRSPRRNIYVDIISTCINLSWGPFMY